MSEVCLVNAIQTVCVRASTTYRRIKFTNNKYACISKQRLFMLQFEFSYGVLVPSFTSNAESLCIACGSGWSFDTYNLYFGYAYELLWSKYVCICM